MLDLKTGLIAVLLSLAVNAGGAAGCGANSANVAGNNQQTNSRNATTTRTPTGDASSANTGGEITILSQSAHSTVSESFIIVARDLETYKMLRRLDDKLPAQTAQFFKSNAVVAAFLGQRRTAGYGVEMTRANDGSLRIKESEPPRDAMVAQVLTAPSKTISFPLENEKSLRLDLDKTWREALRPYRLNTGEFTMSGGIAGRSESFQLEGGLSLMRYAGLATLIFDIKSAGGAKPRELKEVATAKVEDEKIGIYRLNAGSLVEPPANWLIAVGELKSNESELTLEFHPVPTTIADAFQGSGRIKATATGPPPPKKAVGGETVM